LSGREVRRRAESVRLQNRLRNNTRRGSATLKKLYNCPKRVSAKL
jgi:hypothetical protein